MSLKIHMNLHTSESDRKFSESDFLKKVTDRSPGLITVYNVKTGEYVFVNHAIIKILGYTPEEFLKGGVNFAMALVYPGDLQRIMKENDAAVANAKNANSSQPRQEESIVNFEYRMKHKNGDYRWLHTDGSVFSRDKNGEIECVLNITIDITARKIAEEKLQRVTEDLEQEVKIRASELTKTLSHLSAIVDFSFDAIITKDLNGIITSWNRGAERIYGYYASEVIGKPVSILFPKEKQEELSEILAKLARGEFINHYETVRVRKDGEKINISLSISPIKGANGEVIGAATIARDTTESRLAEEKILFQYYHDPLTRLPNRTWFQEQINLLMATNQKFAILLIDLDRFKFINESFGHRIGDQLIQEVGFRLKQQLDGNCELSRFGGDEFGIIVKNADDLAVGKLAEKILADFKHYFKLESLEIYLSPSIGVSAYPENTKAASEIIQCAEVALYYAKEQGKNNYQLYRNNMSIKAGHNVNLESDLHRAIENEQFVVHYQPQVHLKTGEILEIEALVRAQDSQLHLTLPDNFIPLAETTGLIEPLGELVLKMVCKQMKVWNESGFPHLMAAVNVSSRQLKQKDFCAKIEKIISDSGIQPSNLELEITERVLFESTEQVLKNMKTLTRWGVKFSLDDFSMGYSSLNYIHKFPLNVLKIDRTFVTGLPKNKTNRAIAQSIITLGHNLGMMVVAEGVETTEQLQFLYDNHCDKVQGYIFNAPVPADSINEILGESRFVNVINKIKNPTLPLDFLAKLTN